MPRPPIAPLLVSAALLAASVMPVSAMPGVTETCTGDVAAAFDSLGQCVSTFETFSNDGNADVVGLCKFFGDNSGFPRHGACVAALRALGF